MVPLFVLYLLVLLVVRWLYNKLIVFDFRWIQFTSFIRKFSHRNSIYYIDSSITYSASSKKILQRFSRVGPRGRGREWATLGVHPLSWLLSNNRLEEVCGTLTKDTFSSRLVLSNQDKGCTPSHCSFFSSSSSSRFLLNLSTKSIPKYSFMIYFTSKTKID